MASFFLENADTDYTKTIDRLVELQKRRGYRFQTNLLQSEQTSLALADVKEQLTQLQETAKKLFGLDSVFKAVELVPSDSTVLSGTALASALRHKSSGAPVSHELAINKLAKAQVITSKALPAEFSLPSGTVEFLVEEEKIAFSFSGGDFKSFKLFLQTNRTATKLLNATWVQQDKEKFILMLAAKKTGVKNRFQVLKDEGGILTRLGFFRRRRPLLVPLLSKAELEHQPLPYSKEAGFLLPPNRTAILQLNKPLDFSKIKEASFLFSKTPLVLKKQSASNALPQLEKPPATASNLSNPTLLATLSYSVVEDPTTGLSAEAPSTLSFFTNQLSSSVLWFDRFSLKIGTAKKVLLHSLKLVNPTSKQTYSYKHFFYEKKPLLPDRFIPIREIVKPQNAAFTYRGLSFQRESNQVDNLLEGITLNLKKTTAAGAPVSFQLSPASKQLDTGVANFLERFNLLMQTLNVYLSPTLSALNAPNLPANYRVRVGLLRREITIVRLKERLADLLSKPYPTSDPAGLTLLSQVGVSRSFNFSSPYSLQADQVVFSESLFQTSVREKFHLVKDLFGFEGVAGRSRWSGFAYEVDALLRAYLRAGGVFYTLEQSAAAQRKNLTQQVEREKKRVDAFRAKTEQDFTKLEAAKREQQEMQNWFKNLQGNSP